MMGRGKGNPEPMKMYHEIVIHVKKTFICFGIHIYREKRGDTSGGRSIFHPYPHCIQQPGVSKSPQHLTAAQTPGPFPPAFPRSLGGT